MVDLRKLALGAVPLLLIIIVVVAIASSSTTPKNSQSKFFVAAISDIKTMQLSDAFSDYRLSTSDSLLVDAASDSRLYYIHFPPRTARFNDRDVYLLSDARFIGTFAGLLVDGSNLDFAPKECSLAADSDFAPSNYFGAPGAIELRPGDSICLRLSDGSKESVSVSRADANLVELSLRGDP